jgi:spore maturation protein CgeB
MACGIPLVSVWWNDEEELFTPGKDYLVARNPEEMTRHLRDVLNDAGLAAELTAHGLKTIQSRHTCSHRVRELLNIFDDIKPSKRTATYAS